jgi:hypothetical protein
MSRLIELPLADGGSVAVEVSDADGAGSALAGDGPIMRGGRTGPPTMRGLRGREPLMESATQTLEASVAKVVPALRAVLGELRSISGDLTQIELDVGLKLTGEAGMVLARAGTEANFQVHLTWMRTRDGDSKAQLAANAGEVRR